MDGNVSHTHMLNHKNISKKICLIKPRIKLKISMSYDIQCKQSLYK